MKEQLYKKYNGKYSKIFPLNYIQNLIDSESGNTLASILQAFNNIYIPYQDNPQDTRNLIPESLRRKGLWITYNNGEEYITEYYKGDANDVQEHWAEDYNWEIIPNLKYVQDNASKLPNGIITADKLSPALLQLIQSNGKVVNMADDEDIEEVNSTLKFKDRKYNPELASGKGYKILRKNWTKVGDRMINLLTQDMINEPNTIYEIKYDFDLNNKYIKLPLNSDLFINGGSIKNGAVVCNNSRISDFKAISDIRGICLDYNTGKETTIYGDIINRNVILAGNVNICWNNLDKFGLSKNLLALQKVGINNVIIAFKTRIVNSEFVLLDQDDKKIDNLNSYINEGARIKMLKFHQPENEEDKWIRNPTEEQKPLALEYAIKFKNYVLENVKEFSKYIDFEYVGISNESNYWETNTEFATILSDLAKEVTTLGYKPICSRNNNATMPTVLAKQLYMYGYNNYGSLSYKDDKSKYNKYMYLGFHKIYNSQLSSVKNPLIFITECGVLPRTKSLRAGSYYDMSLLGKENFKIPIIYYKAMKDYIENNPVYCVADWWFENYTVFDINNNDLHKELYNILLNL